MMSFDELCGSALGAADYTAISEAFHTIFVHGVPMMSLVHLNQVRRGEAGRARRPPFPPTPPLEMFRLLRSPPVAVSTKVPIAPAVARTNRRSRARARSPSLCPPRA